jgi:hypothetical protein
MKHSPESLRETTAAAWGALGVGLVVLVVGVFFDPIGSDPDSGLVQLGVTGTRWLLGAFGVFFLVVGGWAFSKRWSAPSK